MSIFGAIGRVVVAFTVVSVLDSYITNRVRKSVVDNMDGVYVMKAYICNRAFTEGKVMSKVTMDNLLGNMSNNLDASGLTPTEFINLEIDKLEDEVDV